MKPDKLPTVDPLQPNVYRVLIETAQRVRRERQAVLIAQAARAREEYRRSMRHAASAVDVQIERESK